MAHSKRNTSRAVFTSHERALAKSNWSTGSARLNRDSFLPFGSCGLCLGIAREPVACLHGDIFCHECALANLLAQKRDIKRTARVRRDAQQEAERIKAAEHEEDCERVVRDFETSQVGLPTTSKRGKPEIIPGELPSDALVLHPGGKNKFALDEKELSRIADEDRLKARQAIDDEKQSKPTLPSFWTPSLTPNVQTSKLPVTSKLKKVAPVCPSSPDDNPHPISAQTLVVLHFSEDPEPSTKDNRWACPSCLRGLSNSSNPVMTERCGHVLCSNCVDRFLLPPKKTSASQTAIPIMCYVCDTPVTARSSKATRTSPSLPPGLIPLKSEGTGFSARGSSTVEKSIVAFQC